MIEIVTNHRSEKEPYIAFLDHKLKVGAWIGNFSIRKQHINASSWRHAYLSLGKLKSLVKYED